MKKTSASTISNLPIIALAIIFSLSTLLITSCGSGNSDKPATTQVDSTKASFKILGTWVKVDDPTNKAVFTADSVKEISGGHTPKIYKYNWINEQEMDVTYNTDKKGRVKITIDGDNLTLSAEGNEVKFIREEAYTANAATTDKKGDIPLTPEAKAYENNLLDRWVDDNEIAEFTKDTLKVYNVGQTVPSSINTYKVIDENNLELTDVNTLREWKAKMTISDNKDTLIWENSFSTFIFIRDKTN